MQIAVDGCMHGELDIVYDMLCTLEEAEGIKIDLLLCYGDFQVGDLSSVSPVPYSFDTALRERRQRHMIKNRESAAGSCARKQQKLWCLYCSCEPLLSSFAIERISCLD